MDFADIYDTDANLWGFWGVRLAIYGTPMDIYAVFGVIHGVYRQRRLTQRLRGGFGRRAADTALVSL